MRLPSTARVRRLQAEADRYDELLFRHVSERAAHPPAGSGADDLLIGLALHDAAQQRHELARQLVRRDQIALGGILATFIAAAPLVSILTRLR